MSELMSYVQRSMLSRIGLEVTVVSEGVQTTGKLVLQSGWYTVTSEDATVSFKPSQVTIFVKESRVNPRVDRNIILIEPLNLDNVLGQHVHLYVMEGGFWSDVLERKANHYIVGEQTFFAQDVVSITPLEGLVDTTVNELGIISCKPIDVTKIVVKL